MNRRQFLIRSAAALVALTPALRAEEGDPDAIQSRAIPSTGERLPVVGVGTWQTFDVDPDDADAMAARRAVLAALFEAGGSVIDSSPMYGRSEAVVGALLEQMALRERAFLATKVWTDGEESGREQIARSMRRMHAGEALDLMQVHNLRDFDAHWPTLLERKAAGSIRYLGVTHYTRSGLDALVERIEAQGDAIDFVQCAYSVNVREAEDRLLPLAADRGVAVLINRPFEGGDVFRRLRGEALPGWAAEIGCESWAQLMLKFVLAHPAVTCVIPGTGKARHMRDNLGAGRGALPDDEMRSRIITALEA